MDLTGEVRPCLTYFERGSPKTRKIQDSVGVDKVQGTTLDLAHLTFWTQMLHAGHLLPQALDDAGLFSDEETSPHRLAG